MSNDILTKEALAKDQEVLGDQSRLLAEAAADKTLEARKDGFPYITVERCSSTFIQTDPGWTAEANDANGEPFVPIGWQGTRNAQWFRFRNGRLEWGGKAEGWDDRERMCVAPPPADDKYWSPVKGIAGILKVHKSETESMSFFTIENATNKSVMPLIPAREHNGTMALFKKTQHAIFVAKNAKYIHCIGDGTTPGRPCYVTGCMIPGDYEKDVELADLRSTRNPGAALDKIIKDLGGWKEGQAVRIIVS